MLGGRASAPFALETGQRITLSAELGRWHEFSAARSVVAAFTAAPGATFAVRGVDASRNAAVVGLDANVALMQSVALLGNSSGRFSGVQTSVGGFGGLQVTW